MPATRFDVNEDDEYQQKEWRFERAGAAVWVLVLLAAVAGLLGPGRLSSARVASGDGSLEAEYNRITRHQANAEISLMLGARAVHHGAIRLRVDRSFIEAVDLDQVQPEPREMVQAGDRVVFVFPAEPARPATVKLRFKPDHVGVSEHTFAVENGAEVRLRTFVLP